MAPLTSPSKALCLLAMIVTMAVTFGAASASAGTTTNKRLPGSCLMAASTLCANADTDAMRCLRRLAITGDARVPSACSEALLAGGTVNPRLKQSSRVKQLARMLHETHAPCTGTNTCFNTFGAVPHKRCNDVLTGCGGCAHGTYAVTSSAITVVQRGTTNPHSINCANICCKGPNNAPACCWSLTFQSTKTSVFCHTATGGWCSLN